jgi:vancomycin resistance protein YoaR
VAALARPVVWLTSLFTTTQVAAVMDVDESTLARSPLAAVIDDNTIAATEPSVTAEGPALVVVPGTDGSAITLGQLSEALLREAEASQTNEVNVSIEPQPLAPRYSDAEAQALVDLVNTSLAAPITVVTGSVLTSVDGASVASWLTITPGDDGLELGVDPQLVIDGMTSLNPTINRSEVPVSFAVVDGAVTTSPGTGAVVCCDPASADQVIEAITTPARIANLTMIEAPLVKGPQWAASLGIVEPVGTFTTNYPAGQDRAINIVRIAEIIRGTVIEPGTTFSVNETTGPRTEAQGFVPGGIIVNGKLSTGVGGGISQFATTLFNAAFFAGLDIPDFMMHTLYISRYPYGREATLAWPTVDLKITNNTPYGILIWTESTPESITVTLYSTPWIVGDQTGQTTEQVGACTKVTTERTRTWLADNRSATDVFIGRYQPEEGVLC